VQDELELYAIDSIERPAAARVRIAQIGADVFTCYAGEDVTKLAQCAQSTGKLTPNAIAWFTTN